MTIVVAIANEKGGVGKTTTALSLGAALAELRQQVLLIDLDPQANLTLGVGLRPGQAPASIADVLLGDAALSDVARPTDVAGLWIAPASDELLQAERFLPVRQDYELVLSDAVASSDPIDSFILDCPQRRLGGLEVALVLGECPKTEEELNGHGIPAGRRMVLESLRPSNERFMVRGGVEEAAGRVGKIRQDRLGQMHASREPSRVEVRLIEGKQPEPEGGVVIEEAAGMSTACSPAAVQPSVGYQPAKEELRQVLRRMKVVIS